ncbi:MAG: 5'-methylthioadenosine/S-adenosylhomocysteine nucleosidase [Bdellovibrionaceae bacterium]|nr:5'-methylthioadenosine/S-adenosylhomocysteine nucleosidase [Pseudobdellovibrionaceae bacterium]
MVLILCPLSLELQNLIHSLKADGYVVLEERAEHLPVYICKDLGWILSHGGHGKTQFAIQTQFLANRYSPLEAVICAGACGALAPNLKPGDVVVATKTVEHDYKERFFPQPPPAFSGSDVLIEKIKTSPLTFHLGIIASGDEDIVDNQRAKELLFATEALAVAWEGAGGARACKFLKIPYLEIRGVTDSANDTAVSDFKAHLKVAMNAIYKLMLSSFKK